MKPAANAKKTKTTPQTSDSQQSPAAPDALQRTACIATAAYFKAAERGFAPGGELDDWLAAETEFDLQGAGRL